MNHNNNDKPKTVAFDANPATLQDFTGDHWYEVENAEHVEWQEVTEGRSLLDSDTESDLQASIGSLAARADKMMVAFSVTRFFSKLAALESATHTAFQRRVERVATKDITEAYESGRYLGQSGLPSAPYVCLKTAAKLYRHDPTMPLDSAVGDCHGECDPALMLANEILTGAKSLECPHQLPLGKDATEFHYVGYNEGIRARLLSM